jgi:hypothetical protein
VVELKPIMGSEDSGSPFFAPLRSDPATAVTAMTDARSPYLRQNRCQLWEPRGQYVLSEIDNSFSPI